MIRTSIPLVRGALVALAICAAPASPAFASTAAAAIEERVATLNPGQFVWHPGEARSGPVEIVVSLPLQIAYVYRGGTLIGASTVSTGQPGNETPTGRFEILQKRKEHYSNLYDNAPMPFMQRLTWDGVAFHAGRNPGYPASHGCIRLPTKFAQKLYEATSLGAKVMIVDDAPSAEAAYAMLSGREFQMAMGGPEEELPEESGMILAGGSN